MREPPTEQDRIGLHRVRTAAAFALSMAIQQVFPKAIVLRTRVTATGFACDILVAEPLEAEMLPLIDRQMHELMIRDPELVSGEMMRSNVVEFYRHHGLAERAEQMESGSDLVETLRSGEYLEILEGPHATSLGEAKAFALQGIDHHEQESGEVTTVFGAAFPNRQQLKQFMKRAAAAVDHRVLGRELALCLPDSSGDDLWLPKGIRLREALLDKWRATVTEEHFAHIGTPLLVEGELPRSRLALHAELFATQPFTDKELPVRWTECAPVAESVPPHAVCGLLRQSRFTADTSSLFCRPDQVIQLLISSLQTINKTITMLGLRCQSKLCMRGEGSSGAPAQWNRALAWIEAALKQVPLDGLRRERQPLLSGPRVEFLAVDPLDREWLVAWAGVDCVLSDRLKPVVLLERSLLASVERVLALLLEQQGGVLPLWLAPEQLRVLPVDEGQAEYAEQVAAQCRLIGLRVDVDSRPQTLAARVFAAEAAKVPFIAVVGEKEQKERVVTMRTGQHRQRGDRLTIQEMAVAIHKKTLEE